MVACVKWEEYPRPALAVDVAVLTVVPAEEPYLAAVVHDSAKPKRSEQWDLPGGFAKLREPLGEAAVRVMGETVAIDGLAPRQLRTLDGHDHGLKGWVVSVTYLDAVPFGRVSGAVSDDGPVRLAPVISGPDGVKLGLPDGSTSLPWDHDLVVGLAVENLRARYAAAPDPDGLLESAEGLFTLSELRRLHEAVAGASLQRDTFRRNVLDGLEATAWVRAGSVGRPATLYRLGS